MASDWSLTEVELVVADYFSMLADELARRPYSKTAHRERLRPLLTGRSDGSIEFKHANISAVLINYGQPYIDGYKPRFKYQSLLERVVLERLDLEPGLFDVARRSALVDPAERPMFPAGAVADLLATPPEPTTPRAAGDREDVRVRHVDFVRLDAENRRLGRMGEEWALEFERRRIHDLERRPDLARRVEWVAQTRGDGLGYDIASFNRDGSERLIEVKTTGLGKYFPFAVTRNEVRVSERARERYHLYRVFQFSTNARLYTLQGALSEVCRLEPTQYSARVGRAGTQG